MSNPVMDTEMMLKRYIYDYMVKKNMHATADLFLEEAKIPYEPVGINDVPSGFLYEWWKIFTDVYFDRQSSFQTQIGTIEDQTLGSTNQEELLQFSQEPCPHIEILQPEITLPIESLLDVGVAPMQQSLPINTIQHKKGKEPIEEKFIGMDEKWLKQSSFLRLVQQDVISKSVNKKATPYSNCTTKGFMQNVIIPSFQPMTLPLATKQSTAKVVDVAHLAEESMAKQN